MNRHDFILFDFRVPSSSLIFEGMSVDRLAAPARAGGVAALHDKLPDDPVELGLVVVVLQAQLGGNSTETVLA